MSNPVDRRTPPFRTTGQVAQLLGATEPQVAELVRRGRVQPEPPILAGRRLWSSDHLLQAARALDRLTDELQARIAAEVAGD